MFAPQCERGKENGGELGRIDFLNFEFADRLSGKFKFLCLL
jgi:hypothetical protein